MKISSTTPSNATTAGCSGSPTDQEPVTIKGVNPEKFHDNSIAMVTPDGKLLMNRSVSQILIDNGLEHLVFWGDG